DPWRRGAAQFAAAIGAEVAIADIVGEDEHDIRPLICGERERRRPEKERGCESAGAATGLQHASPPFRWDANPARGCPRTLPSCVDSSMQTRRRSRLKRNAGPSA